MILASPVDSPSEVITTSCHVLKLPTGAFFSAPPVGAATAMLHSKAAPLPFMRPDCPYHSSAPPASIGQLLAHSLAPLHLSELSVSQLTRSVYGETSQHTTGWLVEVGSDESRPAIFPLAND